MAHLKKPSRVGLVALAVFLGRNETVRYDILKRMACLQSCGLWAGRPPCIIAGSDLTAGPSMLCPEC